MRRRSFRASGPARRQAASTPNGASTTGRKKALCLVASASPKATPVHGARRRSSSARQKRYTTPNHSAATGMSKHERWAWKKWRGTTKKESAAKRPALRPQRVEPQRWRMAGMEAATAKAGRRNPVAGRTQCRVWAKSAFDHPNAQRQRRLVEKEGPPAGELLGGGEVDALVAGEAYRFLGRPEHDEGDQPQPEGDAPIGAARGAAHGGFPSTRSRTHTSRSCGSSAWTVSVTGPEAGIGASPETKPSCAWGIRRCSTPAGPPRVSWTSERSRFQACSQVMPASRRSVPAGTSGNRTAIRAGPPGGGMKRQRTGW